MPLCGSVEAVEALKMRKLLNEMDRSASEKDVARFNCSSFITNFIDYEIDFDLKEITRH